MIKNSIVIEEHHKRPMGLSEFLALCEKPSKETINQKPKRHEKSIKRTN